MAWYERAGSELAASSRHRKSRANSALPAKLKALRRTSQPDSRPPDRKQQRANRKRPASQIPERRSYLRVAGARGGNRVEFGDEIPMSDMEGKNRRTEPVLTVYPVSGVGESHSNRRSLRCRKQHPWTMRSMSRTCSVSMPFGGPRTISRSD